MIKNFNRFLIFLFLFACFAALPVFASSDDSASEDVAAFSGSSATSYLLMDGFTRATLASSNAKAKLPMASTTKIMTCVVALENAAVSDVVQIPKEAVGIEGSSVYLSQGERLTLEELLYALMLESANDAAVAIALHVSEDIDAFARLMNEKASDLGMEDTHFVNPHGLPADGHYSTAFDLCKLLAYAMENEAFRAFSGTKTTTISAPNDSKRFLSNHNKLLRIYDSCIAGKTGFTKEAGRCLVSAAEKNGRLLICATLGDPNDWIDHVSLFDYGFSLFSSQQVAKVGEFVLDLSVVGGVRDKVSVTNLDSFSLHLRSNEKITRTIELPRFVYAEVQAGEELGNVVFSLDGVEIARVKLVAGESIAQRIDHLSFWERLLLKIKLWMN